MPSVVLDERVNTKRAAYLIETYTFDQLLGRVLKLMPKNMKYLETKIKDQNNF